MTDTSNDSEYVGDNYKFVVVIEWDLVTPNIVGWSTLKNATKCRTRAINNDANCKRVTIYRHGVSGIYTEIKSLNWSRSNDSRNS